MAQVADHCIKEFRPSLAEQNGGIDAAPAEPSPRTALESGFFHLEGPIDSLSCMAQLAADNAASFDFERADDSEKNQLLFTIYHLHELITNLRDQYYREFGK